MTLTDVGADFLARIEPIMADLDEAEQNARGAGELRGLLRVALGTSLSVRIVVPCLKPFLDRHPGLQLELILDDQRQDLVRDGIDVAVRFGQLADSNATARTITTWPRLLAASPLYLATAPGIAKPSDLAAHSIIVGPQGIRDWEFRKDGTMTSLRIAGRIKIPAFEGALAAAAAGIGIVLTSTGASKHELDSGALVPILPDWDLGSVDLHAIFPGGRAAKPSARALVTYLAETLSRW